MQKDFNRLRTGFVGACAALALMQGCVNDVKYGLLIHNYLYHLVLYMFFHYQFDHKQKLYN